MVMNTTNSGPASMVHDRLAKHMLADGMPYVLDLAKSHGPYLYDASAQREIAADRALDDMLEWFFQVPSASCAIFDATNSSRRRRNHIVSRFAEYASIQVVFLEVICDDATVIEENVLSKVRSSPDYAGMSLENALSDFQQRIKNYTQQYEPIVVGKTRSNIATLL